MQPRRLLIINPNTNAAMTASIVAQVRRHLPDWIATTAVTARFGAPVIATRAAFDAAAGAVTDAFRQAAEPIDAVLLACFGDPGLADLRHAADKIPVSGLADACFHAAGERFAVVTLGPDWQSILLAQANALRPGACVGVWALPGSGLDFMREPAALSASLDTACAEAASAGAATIILGGAVLAGHAHHLHCAVPLIDCIETAAAAVVRALSP